MTDDKRQLHLAKALGVVVLVAVLLGLVLGAGARALGVPERWRGALTGGVIGGVSVWLLSALKRTVARGGAPWLRR